MPANSPAIPRCIGEFMDDDMVTPVFGAAAGRRAMTVGAGDLLVAELAYAHDLAVALQR